MTSINEEPSFNTEDSQPNAVSPPKEPSKSNESEVFRNKLNNLKADDACPAVPHPGVGGIKLKSGAFPSTNDMELQEYLQHLTLWKQPILSAKYLLAVLVLFYSTMEGGYTYVGFLCWVLTIRLLAVAIPQIFGHKMRGNENAIVQKLGEYSEKIGEFVKLHTKLPSTSGITFWTNGLSEYFEVKLVGFAKAFEEAEKSFGMLKVVLMHLGGAALIFFLFSLRTVLFLSVFVYLTIPAIYSRFYKQIDPVLETIQAKIKPLAETIEAKGKVIAESANNKSHEVMNKVKAKVDEIKSKRAGAKKTN